MDHIVKEADETELHPNRMNKEDGFSLSKVCKPLIHSLKEEKKDYSKDGVPQHHLSSGGAVMRPCTLLLLFFTLSPQITKQWGGFSKPTLSLGF
jgi:hypothetical protein